MDEEATPPTTVEEEGGSPPADPPASPGRLGSPPKVRRRPSSRDESRPRSRRSLDLGEQSSATGAEMRERLVRARTMRAQGSTRMMQLREFQEQLGSVIPGGSQAGGSRDGLDGSCRREAGKRARSRRAARSLMKLNRPKMRSALPRTTWWHSAFVFSFVGLIASVVTLWAPPPIGVRTTSESVAATPWSDGCQGVSTCICPRETICADNMVSLVLLTIARATAWFDYPLYMLMFLSKAHNLNNFLQGTILRCWINFSDYHRVHGIFGLVVGIESACHSFFHLLRWSLREDDIKLLWTTTTGRTGLIVLISSLLVVLPMAIPLLKGRMPFEWRKGLHYVSLLWAAALMHHAPTGRIFWLIGVPLFVYLADKLVGAAFKTYLIENAHFQRISESTCLMSFETPPSFGKQNAAYVYLMLPWLSKYQFHAFSVFPALDKSGCSSICISKASDKGWTSDLIDEITTPCHRMAFVVGPFISPFSSSAMDKDNLLVVASGIGVTPAISLIQRCSMLTRRINFVWICRDAGLVEHFVENVKFSELGYNLIYYSGERSIVLSHDLPPNIFIFQERPVISRVLNGIVLSIVNGDVLPEELCEEHRTILRRPPVEVRSRILFEKALSIYSVDQLFEMAAEESFLHRSSGDEESAAPSIERGYLIKAKSCASLGLNNDCLVQAVTYQGVLAIMQQLFGDDCNFIEDHLERNFDIISSDGELEKDGFVLLMKTMAREGDDALESSLISIEKAIQDKNDCLTKFGTTHETDVSRGLDEMEGQLQRNKHFFPERWSMLYCGGSRSLVNQLKAYKKKTGITLSIEKFDW